MTRRFVLFSVSLLLAIALLPPSTTVPRLSAQSESEMEPGIVAFIGIDTNDDARIFLLDTASNRAGQIDVLVSHTSTLAWHPDGETLAFVTADGGYGLLRSLRNCFGPDAMCTDVVLIIPPFVVLDLAWNADGDSLIFSTDDGLLIAPPRAARLDDFTALDLACDAGFAAAGDPLSILCANQDAVGNTQVALYARQDSDLEATLALGSYPALTAWALHESGASTIGTQEAGGDSGFYVDSDGTMTRLATFQVHVYDIVFHPSGSPVALAGAISDSTGDGTLSDGDTAEVLVFDPATETLEQIPGFTEATALTWSPDGSHLLVIQNEELLVLYSVDEAARDALASPPLLAGLRLLHPAWHGLETDALPAVPTATPVSGPSTPIPTPTRLPTQPNPPTVTPLPTFTPFPTVTPIPSATPGSPQGVGCEFALNPPPVAVGDIAEVTPAGAAVRFRGSAALNGPLLRELAIGTRMRILNGPFCSQGYRWWQAQLEADGLTGYLADGDLSSYWIQAAAPPPPTERISFYADRYTIIAGECVTIWWEVEGIREVYYQSTGVTGAESRIECPLSTTTYTLTVIRRDGSTVNQTVTITVNPAY